MAKLGLIFVCVFLLVQWSLAARVVRDAPVETTSDTKADAFNLNEALATLSQGLQNTFSKANIDKFMDNLGETGEKFKEFGQGLINKAQETAASIAHPEKKGETST